jgi:hypothetical protein
MNTLAACVAELLIALQRAIESGRATIGGLQDRIYSLERYHGPSGRYCNCLADGIFRLLNDVANFIRRHSNDSWVKWFVHSQDWDLQIEEFYKRINASSVAFQARPSIVASCCIKLIKICDRSSVLSTTRNGNNVIL